MNTNVVLICIFAVVLVISFEIVRLNRTMALIEALLRDINERIADVTTEDYRHLSRIRIEKEI